MSATVLQITDLHLLSGPETLFNGVPTHQSLREVLTHIKETVPEVDLFVFTGDLAHDELRETYTQLRNILEPVVKNSRLLPGNHDHRTFMREVFPECVAPAQGDPFTEPIGFVETFGNWRLIGLDSHVFGEIPGFIQESQYDWLESQLQNATGSMVGLFLHHPPCSVETPWMDKIGLQNPQRLRDLVKKFSEVRFISCGHVHHEFQAKCEQADFLTTPATSVQFKPQTESLELEAIPPGFRVFELSDAGFASQVHRLPRLTHPPKRSQ